MDQGPVYGQVRLSRLGGFAAIFVAAILLIGLVGFGSGVPSLLTWLTLLFAINAGLLGASLASLKVFNPLDVTVLVLTAAAFAGFWPGPGRPHKVWMGLAIALPLAGIALLFATGLAGRSGLMGGGLILSVLMLGDRRSRPLGYVGIAANLLLLVGDFGTVGRSPIFAALVGAGYLLLILWFTWMAARLLTRHN